MGKRRQQLTRTNGNGGWNACLLPAAAPAGLFYFNKAKQQFARALDAREGEAARVDLCVWVNTRFAQASNLL